MHGQPRGVKTPATAKSAIRCWRHWAGICANYNVRCRKTRRPTNTQRCNQTRYPARLATVRHRSNVVRPQNRSLAPDDRSLQVHSCHGPPAGRRAARGAARPARDDSRWSRANILVMCPDIETYAPLIWRTSASASGARCASRASAAGAARRPLVAADQSAAGCCVATVDARGRRVTAARCSTSPIRAGTCPVQLQRRRFGGHHPLGPAVQHPVGLRSAAPSTLRGRLRPQHVAVRHRPGAGRGRDVDDSGAWIDATLPLDDVSQQSDPIGRPVGRIHQPPAKRGRLAHRGATAARVVGCAD